MSTELLSDFMHLVLDITGAERGMAVDADMQVCAVANIDESALQSAQFNDLAVQTLSDAMARNEAIITNNIITDPAEAPTTNTSFSNLRVVVAIPLPQTGAIYVDQHIRNGVIARDAIEKLKQLAQQVTTHEQTGSTNLRELYNQLSA